MSYSKLLMCAGAVGGILVLSGCAGKNEPSRYESGAVADVVQVTAIKGYKYRKSDKGSLLDAAVNAVFVSEDTQYTVKDYKGRSFEIFMEGIPSKAEFTVGQCVTRWRYNSNPTYPRLGLATADCKAVQTEPQTDIEKDPVDQRWNYEARVNGVMNTWLDSQEDEVIRAWGPPNKAYESNGSRFISWSSQSTSVYSNPDWSVSSATYSCEKTLEVWEGIIQLWFWKGNDC